MDCLLPTGVPKGKRKEEIEEIVRGCDQTLERVAQCLEVEPPAFEVFIFLCADSQHHRKLTEVQGTACSGYSHGDSISLVYGDWKSIRTTVTHELCHVVREQRIAKDLHGLLDEGLAEYITRQVIPGIDRHPAISVQTPLSVLARHEVFFSGLSRKDEDNSSWPHYAHAHAFVGYLIKNEGLDKFKQLCVAACDQTIKNPEERFATAIRKVYGLSVMEIEQQWRQARPLRECTEMRYHEDESSF